MASPLAMTKVKTGHYMVKADGHQFETWSETSEVDGARGRPIAAREWFAAIDGNVVGNGPDNMSVKNILLPFVERARHNDERRSKMERADLLINDIYDGNPPQAVRARVQKWAGDPVEVVPAPVVEKPKKPAPKKATRAKSKPESMEDVLIEADEPVVA